MEFDLGTWSIVARLGLSIGLGVVLGWEREAKGKPAGLKTITLVCLGAATFTVITLLLTSGLSRNEDVMTDPIRLIAGLIGGIGFLGGGAIIQSGESVEGITTAATIWVTGAVGLACGAGYFVVALLVTVGVLCALRLLSLIEGPLRKLHGTDEPPDSGRE